MIKKTAILFLILFLGFIPNGFAIGLKTNSVITRDKITLGDIFYDLEKDADRVLGNAPAPAKDMVLDAKTLLRISLALDLGWRPSHGNETVTLKRQATVIEGKQILQTIKEKISEDHNLGNFTVKIPAENQMIILPYDLPPTLDVSDLNIDHDKKMFTAMLNAPSVENPIQKIMVSGQIEPVIMVPSLIENIQNGHIISENDIEMIEISERQYTRDTIADETKLIGQTARRMIPAGRPIRTTEITAPQLVARGDLVTLSYNSGVLSLNTQAKALENGAKGDIIRVVNIDSNKTVQAMITNDKSVQIIGNSM